MPQLSPAFYFLFQLDLHQNVVWTPTVLKIPNVGGGTKNVWTPAGGVVEIILIVLWVDGEATLFASLWSVSNSLIFCDAQSSQSNFFIEDHENVR